MTDLSPEEFNALRAHYREQINKMIEQIKLDSGASMFAFFDAGPDSEEVWAAGMNLSDEQLLMNIGSFVGSFFGMEHVPQLLDAIRQAAALKGEAHDAIKH